MIRAFLGIPIPSKIGIDLMTHLRRDLSFYPDQNFKLERLEKLHITLHFFGQITLEELNNLIPNLKLILESRRAFRCEITKAAGFPPRKDSLIAAYVEASGPLQTLHQAIEKTVEHANLKVEGREFKPHITLCRTRSKYLGLQLSDYKENYEFEVSEIILYESQQNKHGSLYIPVHRFYLL